MRCRLPAPGLGLRAGARCRDVARAAKASAIAEAGYIGTFSR
jgi:hypothetical protein